MRRANSHGGASLQNEGRMQHREVARLVQHALSEPQKAQGPAEVARWRPRVLQHHPVRHSRSRLGSTALGLVVHRQTAVRIAEVMIDWSVWESSAEANCVLYVGVLGWLRVHLLCLSDGCSLGDPVLNSAG